MNHFESSNQHKENDIALDAAGPPTLEQRLAVVEQTVQQIYALLLNQRPVKDWYAVAEVSQLLGKAEFTVREWCRLGRVNAAKRECGRGNAREWIISHDELLRIENEGLLPH